MDADGTGGAEGLVSAGTSPQSTDSPDTSPLSENPQGGRRAPARVSGAWTRALGAVLLLLAAYLVIALPFIVVALVIGVIVRGGRLFTSGEAVIVAEIVYAVVALLAELVGPRRLPSGIAVGRREQPRLWALVHRVAEELDVPEPDGVVLSGGTPADVRAVRRPGVGMQRYLVLGAPLLVALSERSLRLVVAHALAHGRRRRPPLADRIACHGVDAVWGLAATAVKHGVAGTFATRYARGYTNVCTPVIELEERFADRYAARIHGTEEMARALDELARAQAGWTDFHREVIAPGLASGCRPYDPLNGLRALLDPSGDVLADRRPGAHAAQATPHTSEAAAADLLNESDTALTPRRRPAAGPALRAARLRARPVAPRGRVAVPGAATDGGFPSADNGGVDPDPAAGSDIVTLDPGTPIRLDDAERLEAHLQPYLLACDDEGLATEAGFARLDGLPVLDAHAYLCQVGWYRAAERASSLALAARRAGAVFPVTLGGVLDLLVDARGPRLVAEYTGRRTPPTGAAEIPGASVGDEGRPRRGDAPADAPPAHHGDEPARPSIPVDTRGLAETAHALAALLACARVEGGRARWRASWSAIGGVVGHDGVDVDLYAPAHAALLSADSARELRARLRHDVVPLHFEPRPPVSFAAAVERETAVGHR